MCATGVAYRLLELPDEARFSGAGVYYGAGASEVSLVRGEDVYIVGGDNSAGHAAMHFSQYCNHVIMVVRDTSLKSTLSQYLIDRISSAPNINVPTCATVTARRRSACRAVM